MTQQSIGLIDPLFQVWVDQGLNDFTITELRDAFIAQLGSGEVDEIEARRVVYSQTLRLLKRGLFEKCGSDHPHQARYRRTRAFDQESFHSKAASNNKLITCHASSSLPEKKLSLALNTKLQTYRAELLTSMGEAEEYKQLMVEFPGHRERISRQHEQALEATTRLLGKVKAIEQLLADGQVNQE